MKITLGPGFCSACGFAMRIAERPYHHLCYCSNRECAHYGEFYEIPEFKVEPGRAVTDY